MNKISMHDFYTGQSILITGATGFLGKIFIEKLLRKCPDVKMLFLLIRARKGKDSQQRIKDLFEDPVFEPMKKANPNYNKKITLIVGDVSEPDLGLSEIDCKKIMDHVTIIFHGAATVRFDEKLKNAARINIYGTKEVLKLCSKCRNLEAFVHISTAYANCNRMEINDEIYTSKLSGDNMIKITEAMPDDLLETCTPLIIDGWPNTYTFTKQIAEELVRSEVIKLNIPAAIFRPAIVTGSYKEPIPGWIDNVYGPSGVIAGAGAGLLRTMTVDQNLRAEIVPVDMTVNAALAVAWEVASKHRNQMNSSDVICDEIPVYNFVLSKNNALRWKDFLHYLNFYGQKNPTIKALWYYCGIPTRFYAMFFIYSFLCHILPAIIVDCALWTSGKKPQAIKLYKKIHKFTNVISYFSTREWNFCNDNITKLWQKLPEKDKYIFNFDVNSIDWNQFFDDHIKAIRIYIFKDTPDSLPAARRKMFWLYILHTTLKIIIFSSIAWVLWPLISINK